jgi:hypothetical protein
MAFLWIIACGIMAGGSALVDNGNYESCPVGAYDDTGCTSVASSAGWASGVAASAFAGLEL